MTPVATIRPMQAADAAAVLPLMRALVTFERGTDFRLDESELVRRGFGDRPEYGAFVAEAPPGDEPGGLVGMAVHYEIPFMHALRPLMMLKWLYVDPAHRGGRVGRRLVQAVARHARGRGLDRFYWFVLHDNTRAQDFYRGLGAVPDPDWRRWAMPADALARLADGPD